MKNAFEYLCEVYNGVHDWFHGKLPWQQTEWIVDSDWATRTHKETGEVQIWIDDPLGGWWQ